MADTKTSALTTLAVADMAADFIPILDTSTATLKKITPDNLLDSETGTWTGVISDGTNNATMVLSTGYYEKHGRQVTARIYLQTSSLGSVTGNIRVAGLPFVNAGFFSPVNVGYANFLSIVAGNSVGGYLSPAADYILLFLWDAITGSSSPMDATEWSADGQCMLTINYNI